MMLLSTAAAGLTTAGIDYRLEGDAEVSAVVHHTGKAVAGSLFCCVPGSRVDGHDLADQVVAAGAAALMVERLLPLDVPQVVVPSVRMAMGPIAARFWGDPSRALTVIGVTGTNGKTTTVSLLRSIFDAAGHRSEVIGTLTSAPGGPPTTPDAPDLQEQLARWRDDGVEIVAMEVSSHALAMGRVEGTWFAACGFTMLGQDHLDLHLDIDHYYAAKARLFRPELTDKAVIRGDDEWGAVLAAGAVVPVRTFTLEDATEIVPSRHGMRFRWRDRVIDLPLAGRHNVANALCAAMIAEWLDVSIDDIVSGLGQVGTVTGRFELIDAGQDFTVAVDYAHTPDALDTVLAAARELAEPVGGRVLVVFGCGGDKDRDKRPQMGRIAAESADVVTVTSDNPRSENPDAIIAEIMAGVPADRLAAVTADVDRRAAITRTLDAAQAGDVVVVAGKGHEMTQTFATETIAFDDRTVVEEVLHR